MKNSISKEQVHHYLEKIATSRHFSKSKRYTQLLQFLTEQSLLQQPLKEQTIGMALFNEGYNPVKDDGKVRVYMYNLRKKLSTYYEEEGSDDLLLFVLEKGSYDMQFVPANEQQNKGTHSDDALPVSSIYPPQKNTIWVWGLSLTLLLVLVYYNWSYFVKKELYCWNAFMNSKAINTVVLADHVVMHKSNKPVGTLYMRDGVNSVNEFIAYQQKHPKDTLQLSDYTFFTKSVPFSLLKLATFLTEHNANMIPKMESEFTYDVIKRGNMLYVGQQKTMSLSKELFLKNSQQFTAKTNAFISVVEGKKTVYRSQHGENKLVEYAMVSYVPISDGHKALFFVSDHDIGVMATVDRFTHITWLEEFYQQLPSNKVYFNALFKVEGLNRLDVSCELVALEVVEE